MENNKYMVQVERELVRCTKEGFLSQNTFPEVFGNKGKNKFIKVLKNDYKIKICTPKCESGGECYSKLEELTDIVLCEFYEKNEIIWPCSNFYSEMGERISSKINITFEFNQEQYKILKDKNHNIPNTIENAYKKIEKGMIGKLEILEKIYGNIKIRYINNYIKISNIQINTFERCGISQEELMFIIEMIFSELIDEKDLNMVNEKFLLRCIKGSLNVKESNRIEKCSNLDNKKILKLANKHLTDGYNERYRLKNHPKLLAEAVILIKDALSQGIDYKILNEVTSFVEVNNGRHKEFVIEGNRTDRDSYIFPIVTDDKLIAKDIMKKHGINTPKSELLEKNMSKNEIEEVMKPFENKPLVVKPRNTNMGTGITVFNVPTEKEKVKNAIDYAFKYDENVLIEEYAKGMEYRFLVINGKCLSVAHRRAASVVGNGKLTIKQLIKEKNKEPWHALTGTPVKMDKPVEVYLKKQGYTYDSIPEKEQRIFLRSNSNCSTGGESIDMTEKMPQFFKKISEQAAKAFNAKVCGVDIIIENINKKNYSIIEINDDPGYSINEWPYDGKGEKIGIAILKMLGY